MQTRSRNLKGFIENIEYLNRFSLNESAKMLDISITNADKKVTDDDSALEFLQKSYQVHEKTDGVKLTLIRNDEPFNESDHTQNWIVAYKGNVIFDSEYKEISRDTIKSESIGTSQYAFVHDHLRRIHSGLGGIPTNTEFFVEYLMNKPTLTRDYTHKHGMVLIGWSPTKIRKLPGKVTTNPEQMNFDVKEWAKELQMDVPALIAEGPLYPFQSLKESSKSSDFLNLITKNVEVFENGSPFEYYSVLKQCFLDVQSVYGGLMEGVVLTSDDKIFKFLQPDQHDKELREKIKSRYKGDRETESKFYKKVNEIASELIKDLYSGYSLEEALEILGERVYSDIEGLASQIPHPKKTPLQIADDVELTAKNLLIKKLDGNNGALFLGRFQPPTKMHIKIVEDAMKRFDYVVLGVVLSRRPTDKSPFDVSTVTRLWREVFPDIEIVSAYTGNLVTVLNKTDLNINTVLAGSDRVGGYEKQLSRMQGMNVEEIVRGEQDVSATKVRNALLNNDFRSFKDNMDKRLWGFFDELQTEIKSRR